MDMNNLMFFHIALNGMECCLLKIGGYIELVSVNIQRKKIFKMMIIQKFLYIC